MNNVPGKPVLNLLAVIADWPKSKKVTELYIHSKVCMHYIFRAEGTASSEVLDMLGLANDFKIVSLCLAPKAMTSQLLERLRLELHMSTPGEGIAFTIPLAGITAPTCKKLNFITDEESVKQIESDVEKMKADTKYDLIISVINQGYNELLMNSAKVAGASGGTIIHARKIGTEEGRKFMGISIQPEKEIVAILTTRENKKDMMKEIEKSCGLNSKAAGIIFALPVEDVAGLNLTFSEQKQD